MIKQRLLASSIPGSYSIEQIKLPKLTNKMHKDYKYPYLEKMNPDSLRYNLRKMAEESNVSLNRSYEMKRRRLEWDEFKDLSSYQIFTLLTLNKVILFLIKEIIDKIESHIYPRRLRAEEQSKVKYV